MTSNETIERVVEVLRRLIYEITHLSAQEEDGSHWCKVSKQALHKAREALNLLQSPRGEGVDQTMREKIARRLSFVTDEATLYFESNQSARVFAWALDREELAALQALAAAPSSPSKRPEGGWVTVPREPTEAMIEAAKEAYVRVGPIAFADFYVAMIEAAPLTSLLSARNLDALATLRKIASLSTRDANGGKDNASVDALVGGQAIRTARAFLATLLPKPPFQPRSSGSLDGRDPPEEPFR